MKSCLVVAIIGLGTWGCNKAPAQAPDKGPQCSDKSIRCLVGPPVYDKWSDTLAERARQKGVTVEPGEVDETILALLGDGPTQFLTLGFRLPQGEDRKALFKRAGLLPDDEAQAPEPTPTNLDKRKPPAPTRYYNASVTHVRTKSNDTPERPMESDFTEDLNLVRVRLPDTDQEAMETGYYYTNVGYVHLYPSLAASGMKPGDIMGTPGKPCLKMDHWYGSVAQLKQDLASRPDIGDVKRVDLVTTGRINGYRFAAIGFYLGYTRADDRTPSFYVVEAGEALNFVRQVFFARGLASDDTASTGDGVATGFSTYNPTRLSDPTNRYKSWLRGALDEDPVPGWDPRTLTIRAAHPSAGQEVTATNKYITVTATLTRDPRLEHTEETPTSGWGPPHFALLCRAVGRVRKLKDGMGGPVVLPGVPDGIFAKFCKNQNDEVHWGRQPDPGIQHTPLRYDPGTCSK